MRRLEQVDGLVVEQLVRDDEAARHPHLLRRSRPLDGHRRIGQRALLEPPHAGRALDQDDALEDSLEPLREREGERPVAGPRLDQRQTTEV